MGFLLIWEIKLFKILDNCSFNELSFGVDTKIHHDNC